MALAGLARTPELVPVLLRMSHNLAQELLQVAGEVTLSHQVTGFTPFHLKEIVTAICRFMRTGQRSLQPAHVRGNEAEGLDLGGILAASTVKRNGKQRRCSELGAFLDRIAQETSRDDQLGARLVSTGASDSIECLHDRLIVL